MKTLDVKALPLDKKVLIEASAGTGKTYTIGLLVVRLLLEKNVPIEKIVLITFTEAAAAELKKNTSQKIIDAYKLWKEEKTEDDKNNDLYEIIKKAKKENAQIKEAALLDAIARIDEMPVFTIHGFCRKLLNEFAFETENFEEKEIKPDTGDIKCRVIADFWRENIKEYALNTDIDIQGLSSAASAVFKHPKAHITGEDFNNLNNLNEKQLKYALSHKLAKEIKNRLKTEKKKLKIMDYDDMIEDCHNAVLADGKNDNILFNAVKKRYDAVMVDEFQDTDQIQYEIFNYLFKNKSFFMIGDPKQAIYRFRGGDIISYKKARESAGEYQFSMDRNFRSEKSLLNAMNVFFNSASFKGKMGKGIDYIQVECGKTNLPPIKEKDCKYKPFVIWRGQEGNNNEDFASKVKKAVINEIKRLLNIENIKPKDITILLNKNTDCLAYKRALEKEGVFAIFSGGFVYKNDACMFLRILLNAICNNNKTGNIRALMTHKFCAFEPKDINDNNFMEWANVIFKAKELWTQYGVMRAVDYFLSTKNLWSSIAAGLGGERNITNIRQILESLNNEEIFLGNIPERINNKFSQMCNDSFNGEETEERLETDEDALKIMTFHKSKGLQFDIVFAPDISRHPRQHKFPHVYTYYENDKQIIAYTAESYSNEKQLSCEAENEESARLLYVALTRAKYRLYAAYNPCYNRSKSYLRQIFDEFCASNTDFLNIQIEELDVASAENNIYKHKKEEAAIKEAKKLLTKIEPSWYRSSFTGISLKLKQSEFIPVLNKNITQPPSGKIMGNLLHNIFENLDFDANEDEIQNMIEIKLGGFKEFTQEIGETRKNWIKEKIKIILNKDLHNAGKLRDIEAVNKVCELNFFISSKDMSLDKIKEVMGVKINNFKDEDFFAKFIKGAIDLVFLGKDKKYYILDWKSNTLNDFSINGMETEAMLPHGYHLQYYIYSVALKRWLEKIQADFDFKKQFGGVYYIFIRGINEKAGNFDGIYFADSKIIADDIIKLDNSFGRSLR